jgi:tetratricopeptide (TPR) repeat protein
MISPQTTVRRRSLARSLAWKLGLFLAVIGLLVLAGFALRDEIAFGAAARETRRAVTAGRFLDAEAPLERWLRARPDNAEAHYLKARVALSKGDLKEVSQELIKARDLQYPRSQLERLDAIIKSKLGKYAEAEAVLLKVFTETQVPDPEVDEALAQVYLQTYRLGHAATVLERWIKDAPNDAKPYLWLTEIDSRTTTDSSALQETHYRAALERDPDLDKARLGLADLLRKARRHDEAALEYDRYLKRNPKDPAGLVGAAGNALGHENEQMAIGYLDRALAVDPDNISAVKERAGIDQRHGNYAGALALLDRAVKLDAFDTEVLYNRSQALARLGRLDESKIDLKKMTKLKEEQAWVLSLRDKIVDNPDNLRLRYELAKWMFDHGRDEQGLRWAEHVLAVQPNFEPAILLVADYYRRKGDIGLEHYYRTRASFASAVVAP